MPRPAWLAIGAAAGALALGVAPGLAVALFGVALACAAAAMRAGRHAGSRPGLLPLGVGIVAIGLRVALGGEAAVVPGPVPTGDGPWVGIVQSVGAPRAGSRPATVRLDGEPPVLVAATLPWYPPVVPNDRVELRGSIRPPPPDDYGAYLVRIGAVGTLRAEALQLLPAEGTVARSLEGFRRSAADGIDRSIPEPEAGLAAGVLIGLRDRVDRDLAAAFTTAGASHVVAISGWNIAIVASALGAIAGGMQRRRRAILTALAILAYVVFVGPSPSVVRAGAMAGVALLARELGRPGTAAAALGWACAVLLLVDPAFVDDAGFRLSVLATAGILAWGSSLTARLAGPEPGRVRRWVAEILGVSFAAQAATTPIVLLEFGRLSLVAPAVNLVVVPLVPPAMAAGALALVVGMTVSLGVPSFVATIVGLPAWALYAAMVGAVRAGAAVPLASLELAAPWDAVSAAAALALILGAARWGDRVLASVRALVRPRVPQQAGLAGRAAAGRTRRAGSAVKARVRHGSENRQSRASRVAVVALVGATLGLTLVVAHRPDGVARVVVLDVGQGDGILVEGGRGGRMVVDGGPDPGRLLIALDERLPPWDRRIDILVLTHPHEDHVAGLALLLERYRVGRVYEPGMLGPGPGYRAWAEVLTTTGTPHGRLSTGDRLTLDAIRFRVLWPDANRVPERPPDGGTAINNVSIVLLGELGQRRFLLAGDIEEGVDPELLGRGLPPLDLLKVAHHGSRTATTREFLEAVRPRVAVVSAGAGNPYGHPAPATVERLAELAGRTYRTDTDGIVEVTFDGAAIRVRTTGPRPVPPRATPRPTARPASAGVSLASTAAGSESTLAATPFLCGVPAPGSGPPATGSEGESRPVEPPTAPEALRPVAVRLGSIDGAAAETGITRLGRIPDPRAGPSRASGYHRPDGDLPGIGDRAGARDRSPRLLLGRRRVRPR
ncbi:MAG TPA: ComEC/Rec2 family competence protein, partial [Candidatus Limnocylindria bacterium]|nr:ComEC/Rec2 family competence protein [Candidatus Limnocylindria bacterium]